MSDAITSTLDNVLSVQRGVAAFTLGLGSGAMLSGLRSAAGLLPEIFGATERLPFNKRCTGERRFCWAEFDIGEVQRIREAAGGTINDVVLAILARAVARYTVMHGETVVRRLMRVVCPVNVRDDKTEAGNRISFLPVALPLDIDDPVQMLRAVARRMEAMKKAKAADMVAIAGGMLGVAPPAAQAILCRIVPQLTLPLPAFHMICTNVPGSREPLYSLGRRMIAAYPQVPTGYDLGINCAVTSYDGKLFLGLIADASAAPDVNRLRDFLHAGFEEMRVSAGLEPAAGSAGQSRRAR